MLYVYVVFPAVAFVTDTSWWIGSYAYVVVKSLASAVAVALRLYLGEQVADLVVAERLLRSGPVVVSFGGCSRSYWSAAS